MTVGNGLFFGLPFVSMGYYITEIRADAHNEVKSIALPRIGLKIIMVVVGAMILTFENIIDQRNGIIGELHYIGLLLIAPTLSGLIIRIGDGKSLAEQGKLRNVRIFSTLIYCSHLWGFYMMDVMFGDKVTIIAKCFVTVFCTFGLCLLVKVAKEKIRILKYLY